MAHHTQKDMSSVSSRQLGMALSSSQIVWCMRPLTVADASIPFAEYDWSPFGCGPLLLEKRAAAGIKTGDNCFVSLLSHFEAQLPARLRGLAKLINVEGALLTFRCKDAETDLEVKGHSDAAFVLNVAKSSSADTSMPLCCLLIDWKTESAMRNAAAVQAQLVFQLLAYRTQYGRAVPVVATDCKTQMRVWALEGSALIEFESRAGGPMTVAEGFGVVCRLLPDAVEAAEAFLLRVRETPLVVADEAAPDDDDDEGTGGDNYGGGSGRYAGGTDGGRGSAASGRGDAADSISGNAAAGGPSSGRSRRPALREMSQAEAALYADAEAEVAKQRLRGLLTRSFGLAHLASELL